MDFDATQIDRDALGRYLKSLDYASGQLVTDQPHHQGEVRLFEPKDPALPAQLIIKRPRGRGVRGWLARKTLKRESRAYERLGQLTGFAPYLGLFSEDRLVLGFVAGTPLSPHQVLAEEVWNSLLGRLKQMHRAGVAHGDLKRHDNLLVSDQGEVVILDLGTAWLRKPGFRPINHWIFRFLAQTDLNAWVKHKHGGYNTVPLSDLPYLKRSWLERLLSQYRSFRR